MVVDVPEAVFSNLGLTYLAHTHIPTIWDDNATDLPRLEWKQNEQCLSVTRMLPNGIVFDSEVTPQANGALMQLRLKNGTDATLTGLRVQVCTMLKGAIGFNVQEELAKEGSTPFVAVRGESTDRWIITAWRPTNRVWTNPPVPCVHSDPIFPDCNPGTEATQIPIQDSPTNVAASASNGAKAGRKLSQNRASRARRILCSIFRFRVRGSCPPRMPFASSPCALKTVFPQ